MRSPVEAVLNWLKKAGSLESPEVEIPPKTSSPELRGIPSEEEQALIKDIVSKLAKVNLIGRKPIRTWRPTFGLGQAFNDVSVLSFTEKQREIIRELHRRATLSDWQSRSRKAEHITLVTQEDGPDGVHVGEDFYFPLIYQPMISSIDMRETFRKLFNGEEVDFSIHASRDTASAIWCINENMQFLKKVTHLPIDMINVGSEEKPIYSLPRTLFGKLEVVDAAEIRRFYAGVRQPVSISQ